MCLHTFTQSLILFQAGHLWCQGETDPSQWPHPSYLTPLVPNRFPSFTTGHFPRMYLWPTKCLPLYASVPLPIMFYLARKSLLPSFYLENSCTPVSPQLNVNTIGGFPLPSSHSSWQPSPIKSPFPVKLNYLPKCLLPHRTMGISRVLTVLSIISTLCSSNTWSAT